MTNVLGISLSGRGMATREKGWVLPCTCICVSCVISHSLRTGGPNLGFALNDPVVVSRGGALRGAAEGRLCGWNQLRRRRRLGYRRRRRRGLRHRLGLCGALWRGTPNRLLGVRTCRQQRHCERAGRPARDICSGSSHRTDPPLQKINERSNIGALRWLCEASRFELSPDRRRTA